MAGPTLLQGKLKLGAFPVGHSCLLGVLQYLCVVGSVLCGHGCRPGEFVKQGYCSSQIIKKEKKQHSAETPFGHICLCWVCSDLLNVLVLQRWDQLPVMGCLHQHFHTSLQRNQELHSHKDCLCSPVALSNFTYPTGRLFALCDESGCKKRNKSCFTKKAHHRAGTTFYIEVKIPERQKRCCQDYYTCILVI